MSVRAKKSLGQNFLRDDTIISRIIDSLDLQPDDTVVEIGPGLGALTDRLIERAKKLVAVEFDRDLVAHLKDRFADAANFSLHNLDALTVDFSTLLGKGPAKLVANLPYNISTPILQRLADQRHLFSSLVLMFQREVVERITAKPRSSDRGYLSVIVEDSFNLTKLFDVPPTAFQPVPKVWSSVVRLEPVDSEINDHVAFRGLLSASFAQKRKTIINNLKGRYENAADALLEVGIEKNRRAETLTRKEWVRLSQALEKS